jgi:hypothetical protein
MGVYLSDTHEDDMTRRIGVKRGISMVVKLFRIKGMSVGSRLLSRHIAVREDGEQRIYSTCERVICVT